MKFAMSINQARAAGACTTGLHAAIAAFGDDGDVMHPLVSVARRLDAEHTMWALETIRNADAGAGHDAANRVFGDVFLACIQHAADRIGYRSLRAAAQIAALHARGAATDNAMADAMEYAAIDWVADSDPADNAYEALWELVHRPATRRWIIMRALIAEARRGD